MNYKLKLPPHWKMYPIFHVYLLWPIEENDQYGKFSKRLSPRIIKEEEEWEIKDIIDSRTRNRVKEYLIHWKEYPNSEQTWELEKNLGNLKQVLNAYKRRQEREQKKN